jgi:hypothetical protein
VSCKVPISACSISAQTDENALFKRLGVQVGWQPSTSPWQRERASIFRRVKRAHCTHMTVVIKLFPRTQTHTRAAHYGRDLARAYVAWKLSGYGRAKRRRALKAAANAFRVHHLTVRVTSEAASSIIIPGASGTSTCYLSALGAVASLFCVDWITTGNCTSPPLRYNRLLSADFLCRRVRTRVRCAADTHSIG